MHGSDIHVYTRHFSTKSDHRSAKNRENKYNYLNFKLAIRILKSHVLQKCIIPLAIVRPHLRSMRISYFYERQTNKRTMRPTSRMKTIIFFETRKIIE